MKSKTIFWDVDTQADFMMPEGRLYTKDAETYIDSISSIREFALNQGFSIIASSDWHSRTDKEISTSPDYQETFPAHCLANTAGAERVGYLGKGNIEYLDITELNPQKLTGYLNETPFHLVLRKKEINVFSNPNTHELLNFIKPESVFIFGAVFEFCVYQTILGLLLWDNPQITVIFDALVMQDEIASEKKILELLSKDVQFATFAEIRNELI